MKIGVFSHLKFYLKIKMKCCVICGSKDRLEEHHTKPKKDNGYKTITLCHNCHIDIENMKLGLMVLRKEKKISIRRFRQIIDSFENLGLLKK